MTNHETVWAEMAAQYLRDVERALAGVKHPRKSEIIDDVRVHLEEAFRNLPVERRTRDEYAAIIERMGPAEDYAGLLTDEPLPSGRYRRLNMALASCLILAGVCAVIYSPWCNTPSTRSEALLFLGRGFSATPFFAVKGFEGIKPGMSADEVRDALGYPFFRRTFVGRETEAEWEYSAAPFTGATVYKSFLVIFSRETNRVIRTDMRTCRTTRAYNRPSWGVALRGPVTLTRFDGSSRVLREGDPGLYFITFDVDPGRWKSQEMYDYGEKRARDLLQAAGVSNAEVIHLYRGGLHAVSFAAIAPPVYMGWSLNEVPDRMAVYAGGTMYFVPPVISGLDEEEFGKDQVWLIKKVAGISK